MAVDWPEDWIAPIMLEFGGVEPRPHSVHRTGVRIPARHDDDGPPLPLLIRLRSPQRHAQRFVFKKFQILGVEPDDLRTPEAASKSEKNDRLVPQRSDVHAEHFAHGD